MEAIARGYLVGSGWKDYQATGSLCGIRLPPGLRQAERLPSPIFTPSTKAAVGDHDQNVSFDAMVATVGADLAERVREATLAIYNWAAAYAAERGIIIADTKFEFGTDETGKLYVMDEMLTPDSSRFWPADEYRIGINPPSYDKQFVRDYLETLDWNKTGPGSPRPRRGDRRDRREIRRSPAPAGRHPAGLTRSPRGDAALRPARPRSGSGARAAAARIRFDESPPPSASARARSPERPSRPAWSPA